MAVLFKAYAAIRVDLQVTMDGRIRFVRRSPWWFGEESLLQELRADCVL